MKYMGGKNRIGKEISKILKKYRNPNQLYIEPFVGSAGVFQYMKAPKLGCDLDEDIISYLLALSKGWTPPKNVSEELYNKIKNNEIKCSPELRGFVAYGCSYGGKKWGGYARGKRSNGKPRNYANEAYNLSLKKQLGLKDGVFMCCNYIDLNPKDTLIYCDPPYKGVTDYPYLETFNHNKFWNIVRKWNKNNVVIISEYNAPKDFISIWEKRKVTSIDQKSTKTNIEKLFIKLDRKPYI